MMSGEHLIHCHTIVKLSLFTLVLVTLRSVSVEIIDPWISLGTPLLAGGELSDISLVFQGAAILLAAAPSWSVGEVAVEDGR